MDFDKWKMPDVDVVKYFSNVFDINYHKTENELKSLFASEPTAEIISNRVHRLNAIYHTRLGGDQMEVLVSQLQGAGHVFEDRIKSGDSDVIEIIARYGGRNWFVFATKYCSFVKPEFYPIYDGLIGSVLEKFEEKLHFIKSKEVKSKKPLKLERYRNKCDYVSIKTVIDDFKNLPKLKGCTYRDIDKFLWLVGKNMTADIISEEVDL